MRVCLAWHGQLFKDTHFSDSSELETNDTTKPATVQALSNSIYEYLKYYQH